MKYLCLLLLFLMSCAPEQPLTETNGMKFPVKVVSMGVREDVGFNGTKFIAYSGILLLDSKGILYTLSGPAYSQLVKGEIIALPGGLEK
jgi:hypothetical protein